MHVPIEAAREARAHARAVGADCAVGGGSTGGLGKATALESPMPIIAPHLHPCGLRDDADLRHHRSRPEEDRPRPARAAAHGAERQELSAGLPVDLSVASGMNAIARAAESLYARDGNSVMSLMAEEGIGATAQDMHGIVASPPDIDARSDCLYGAWLCGTVRGHVGMALHHTLGGSFNLPHAETHTVVLPHAQAYNAAAAPRST